MDTISTRESINVNKKRHLNYTLAIACSKCMLSSLVIV